MQLQSWFQFLSKCDKDLKFTKVALDLVEPFSKHLQGLQTFIDALGDDTAELDSKWVASNEALKAKTATLTQWLEWTFQQWNLHCEKLAASHAP